MFFPFQKYIFFISPTEKVKYLNHRVLAVFFINDIFQNNMITEQMKPPKAGQGNCTKTCNKKLMIKNSKGLKNNCYYPNLHLNLNKISSSTCDHDFKRKTT